MEAASGESPKVKQEPGSSDGKESEIKKEERSEVKEDGDAKPKVKEEKKEEKGLPLVSQPLCSFSLSKFIRKYLRQFGIRDWS